MLKLISCIIFGAADVCNATTYDVNLNSTVHTESDGIGLVHKYNFGSATYNTANNTIISTNVGAKVLKEGSEYSISLNRLGLELKADNGAFHLGRMYTPYCSLSRVFKATRFKQKPTSEFKCDDTEALLSYRSPKFNHLVRVKGGDLSEFNSPRGIDLNFAASDSRVSYGIGVESVGGRNSRMRSIQRIQSALTSVHNYKKGSFALAYYLNLEYVSGFVFGFGAKAIKDFEKRRIHAGNVYFIVRGLCRLALHKVCKPKYDGTPASDTATVRFLQKSEILIQMRRLKGADDNNLNEKSIEFLIGLDFQLNSSTRISASFRRDSLPEEVNTLSINIKYRLMRGVLF